VTEIKKGLIDYLLTQTPVTDLVSTRIRPGVIEQGLARPNVRIDQTGGEVHYDMGGNSGLCETFLSIICEADTEKAACELAETVRLEVDGFSGSWGDETVRGSFWVGTRDTRTRPQSGGEVGKPSQTIALQVMHTASVPTF
jgi:hypothetical protein